MNNIITPAVKSSKNYNASDKAGCERGSSIVNGKIKKGTTALIYCVYQIEKGIAFCASWDCWGALHEERIPLENLESYSR